MTKKQFVVDDTEYFLSFIPHKGYDGYEARLIKFGKDGVSDPLGRVGSNPISHVLSVVDELGHIANQYCIDNNIRYLFFHGMSDEPKSKKSNPLDSVRTKMFTRWLSNYFGKQVYFEQYSKIGVDFIDSLGDDTKLKRVNYDIHEFATNIPQNLKKILNSYVMKGEVMIVDNKIDEVGYLLTFKNTRYKLQVSDDQFLLVNQNNSFNFSNKSEFETIFNQS